MGARKGTYLDTSLPVAIFDFLKITIRGKMGQGIARIQKQVGSRDGGGGGGGGGEKRKGRRKCRDLNFLVSRIRNGKKSCDRVKTVS